MSEGAEETAEEGSERRTLAAPRRGRLRTFRPYFDAWLLSCFAVAALGVLWSLGDEAARNGAHPLGAFVAAPLLALLALPGLWLLRLFPDRSPSSAVRCMRRLALGAICGLFPSALLAALSVKPGDAGSYQGAGALWFAGCLFGLIAGLVDALALDAAAADEQRG